MWHSHTPGPTLAVFDWLSSLCFLPRISGPFSFKALNHCQETCAIRAEKGHQEGTVGTLQKTMVSHAESQEEGKFSAYI